MKPDMTSPRILLTIRGLDNVATDSGGDGQLISVQGDADGNLGARLFGADSGGNPAVLTTQEIFDGGVPVPSPDDSGTVFLFVTTYPQEYNNVTNQFDPAEFFTVADGLLPTQSKNAGIGLNYFFDETSPAGS